MVRANKSSRFPDLQYSRGWQADQLDMLKKFKIRRPAFLDDLAKTVLIVKKRC